MTKKDLRTGMVLTCKNGNRYLYIKDCFGYEDGVGININSNKSWMDIDGYNDDLTRNTFSFSDEYNIVKIEETCSICDIRKCFLDEPTDYDTIWTRCENFKVICVENHPGNYYTVGKIYEIKNGYLIDDNGNKLFDGEVTSIDDLNSKSFSKWLKVVE